jgi:diguanylate cyclase (GGDEF)-like protein/PAS domain S-box-containing protein
MLLKSTGRRKLPAMAQHAVDLTFQALAYYLIPIAIGIVSLVALFCWDNQYVVGGGATRTLHVFQQGASGAVPDAAVTVTPGAAAARMRDLSIVDYFDTHLSEAPVWFSFTTAPRPGAYQADVIEFPSRHATEIACWDAATLEPLGVATRFRQGPALVAAKAGFALQLWQLPAEVVCRAVFAGPGRLTVLEWPAAEFALSVENYHRKSGLLDGGMIVLALFVLITALINRQPLYVLFSGWLILNLRIAALSAGWDIQWLGMVVPPQWLLLSRSLTIALYGVSTLTLYQTLFRDELADTPFWIPMRITQWAVIPLLVGAVALPYGMFLPMLWVIMAFGFSLMTVGLGAIMLRSRTRVAGWFAASFALTYVASLAEVVSAALGMHAVLNVINSVTAALASSLLAALAVAEQMRKETEQRVMAQEKLEHAYEAMPVGLFTLDIYGNILSANPALLKMLGVDTVVPGRTGWKQFFAESLWTELYERVHLQTETEMQIASRDGDQRFMVSATLARGRIEAVLQDVTEKYRATAQLHFMANNDPLTKVFNRRGIETTFEGALQGLAAGKPLALAYIDLDRFKLINDLFGHAAGDEVLKQVCERMRHMLAGGQEIGRVGGDEFVIVLPDTSISLATLVCRGIVERIGGTPYLVGDKAFHVRASVGVIEVAPGVSMKDAVSTADRACREAKGGHSGSLVVYTVDSAAFQERENELNLVARLAGPNATEGMFLEMQPIMSLSAPWESLNFEVLLRMREADGRVVPAGPLIGAAEKSGRAGVIDRWVLSTTLAWIEAHAAALPNTRFVCMNLSGASLNDERFVQDTLEVLARYAHVTGYLCMEITESVALHDLDNTRRFIDQVRAFGVRVALDDFGAGYTSFSYLKELPADVLKIDGSFIVNINAHPANVAIVEAIVNLAANLGMKTIAEWAEDADTVRTLAEIGVDYVQGYAIARSQLPDKLLLASSSASFIQGADVLQLVRTLGASANEPALPTAQRVPPLHH